MTAAGLGTAFAISLELLQGAVATRHPRLGDVLLATAGCWLGATLGWRWLVQVGWNVGRRINRQVMVGAVAVGNLTLIALITSMHYGADLVGWDPRYPLIIANELTANRPWIGSIRGVAIYPHALSTEEIGRLAKAPLDASVLSLGPTTLYLFGQRREMTVPQLAALPSPTLDLQIESPEGTTWRPVPRGIEIIQPTMIRSTEPAREVSRTIEHADAFTLQAEIAPANLTQTGPARIVSLSIDPYKRNVTLAQDAANVVLRVRTPTNGPDGSKFELQTNCDPLRLDWQQVVAVFHHGTMRIYVNGIVSTPALRLYDPWTLRGYQPSPISTFMLGVALFSTLGTVAVMGVPSGGAYKSWIVAGAACLTTPIAVSAVATWCQHSVDVALVLAGICGTIVGGWLGSSTGSQAVTSTAVPTLGLTSR